MTKDAILNELKLIELRLNTLKARLVPEPVSVPRTSADLYGILKGSDDITAEDIDAVKIRFRERTV